VCFLLGEAELTPHDLKRVVWLLHPEVQSVILMRAVFASAFLLPGMKMINPSSPHESIYFYRNVERDDKCVGLGEYLGGSFF
jgi:hypothetical protein